MARRDNEGGTVRRANEEKGRLAARGRQGKREGEAEGKSGIAGSQAERAV